MSVLQLKLLQGSYFFSILQIKLFCEKLKEE